MPTLTDAIIVESAFDAVIDNALKYAPPSSKIEVSTEDSAEHSEILVRDHGPGIDAADLERATDRFWRGAGSDQKPGSGLGLAIASDLLASVGGQLRVSAPPSGGLTVTFRFAKAVAS